MSLTLNRPESNEHDQQYAHQTHGFVVPLSKAQFNRMQMHPEVPPRSNCRSHASLPDVFRCPPQGCSPTGCRSGRSAWSVRPFSLLFGYHLVRLSRSFVELVLMPERPPASRRQLPPTRRHMQAAKPAKMALSDIRPDRRYAAPYRTHWRELSVARAVDVLVPNPLRSRVPCTNERGLLCAAMSAYGT